MYFCCYAFRSVTVELWYIGSCSANLYHRKFPDISSATLTLATLTLVTLTLATLTHCFMILCIPHWFLLCWLLMLCWFVLHFFKVARFLLMRGEVIHMLHEKQRDPRFKLPLHLAAKGGHADVVRWVLFMWGFWNLSSASSTESIHWIIWTNPCRIIFRKFFEPL